MKELFTYLQSVTDGGRYVIKIFKIEVNSVYMNDSCCLQLFMNKSKRS